MEENAYKIYKFSTTIYELDKKNEYKNLFEKYKWDYNTGTLIFTLFSLILPNKITFNKMCSVLKIPDNPAIRQQVRRFLKNEIFIKMFRGSKLKLKWGRSHSDLNLRKSKGRPSNIYGFDALKFRKLFKDYFKHLTNTTHLPHLHNMIRGVTTIPNTNVNKEQVSIVETEIMEMLKFIETQILLIKNKSERAWRVNFIEALRIDLKRIFNDPVGTFNSLSKKFENSEEVKKNLEIVQNLIKAKSLNSYH